MARALDKADAMLIADAFQHSKIRKAIYHLFYLHFTQKLASVDMNCRGWTFPPAPGISNTGWDGNRLWNGKKEHQWCKQTARHHQQQTHSEMDAGKQKESYIASVLTGHWTVILYRDITALDRIHGAKLIHSAHISHYPFNAHCCHTGTAIKHPVRHKVKPSFVAFDIQALWRSRLRVRVPGRQKLQMTWLNPVWYSHSMLYSCTRMATVSVKELHVAISMCVCVWV